MKTFTTELINEQLRPYEMSLWTLQDSFLAILKAPGIEVKGQIEEPKFTLKSDGTEELSFQVPMYYYKKDEYIENPFWFDKIYGLLLVGLRKIKVIFNKGTKQEEVFEFIISEVTEEHDKGQLYCQVECNGMAFEELGRIGYKKVLSAETYEYFVEDREKEIEELAEKNNWTNIRIQEEKEKIPLNNINYWCDQLFEDTGWTYSIQMNWFGYDGYALFKIGPNPDVEYSSLVASYINNGIEVLDGEDSSQYYTYGGRIDKAIINTLEPIIKTYDDQGNLKTAYNATVALIDTAKIDQTRLGLLGIETEATNYWDLTEGEQQQVNAYRERIGLRRYDKIYEDEYVTSWEQVKDSTDLIPTDYEKRKEKCRSIDEEKSNIYNITQTIAETFGVFCRYKYHYDHNYHIIKKEVIFYNTFLEEQEGQIDITYPYDTTKITRTMDSSDICTKMFVNQADDSGSPSGILTIANCSANKMREEYLLNFDYLYDTGAITQEQYDYIPEFEAAMFRINTELAPIMDNIMNIEQSINNREAKKAFLDKSLTENAEQIEDVDKILSELANNSNYHSADQQSALVEEGAIQRNLQYFFLRNSEKYVDKYMLNFSEKGVLKDSVQIYGDREGKSVIATTELVWNYDKTYLGTTNENKFITGIDNFSYLNSNNCVFITYRYIPEFYYRQIRQNFVDKGMADGQELAVVEKELETLNNSLNTLTARRDTLLKEKADLQVEFDLMMGPAIREGNWTPEDFSNYGRKHHSNVKISEGIENVESDDPLLSFVLDETSFDGELELSWDIDAYHPDQKAYYPFIILNPYIEQIREQFGEEELDQFQFTYISIDMREDAASNVDNNTEEPVNEGEENIIENNEEQSEEETLEPGDVVEEYFVINSEMEIFFLKDLINNKLLICGALTGVKDLSDAQIEVLTTRNRGQRFERRFLGRTMDDGKILDDEQLEAFRNKNIPIPEENIERDIHITLDEEKYKVVYPRIKINSIALKTEESNINVDLVFGEDQNIHLTKYIDYSVLTRQEIIDDEVNAGTGAITINREDAYFITPKGQVFLHLGVDENNNIKPAEFWIDYEISNAELNVYLDALNVLNTNAYPKVSYDVDINPSNKQFIQTAYRQLGRVAHINDYELKFENVRGYVSEITLDLDRPWSDQITIQNYKNKFEDIFGRIMATTQEMISNGDVYNRAAMAFGSNGVIRTSNLQAALDRNDLTYSFMDNGLIINERSGIQSISEDGIVSFTNKGIQTAIEKDENDNWKWRTAITPKGISANLITAGQLNTNLIKLYSDENLRFQMNGEGLYAYKDLASENEVAQYVVFNEDGLALVNVDMPRTVDDEGNSTTMIGNIKRVSIDWDGITIRNLNNEKVFYADDQGNLTLNGAIKAISGAIGGWEITDTGLISANKYNLQLTAGIASGPLSDNSNIIADNVYKVFWAGADLAGNSNFYVDSNGNAFASSLVVNNSLIAKNITLDGIPLNKVLPEIREAEDGIAITALDGYTFNITSDGNLDKENLQFILTGHNIDEIDQAKVKFFIHDPSYEEPETDEYDDDDNDDMDLIDDTDTSDDEEEIDDSDESSDEMEYNWREITETEKQYISFYSSFQYLTFSVNYGIIQTKNIDTIYLKVEYDENYEEIFSINLNIISNFIIVKIFTIGGNYFKNGRNEDNENKITLHANVYKNGRLDTNTDNYIYKWYVQAISDNGEIENKLVEFNESERVDELIITATDLDNISKTNTYTCEVIEQE